ncbi:MAG TPA: hypothetical protein VFD92_18645 [Candidatus Binatia bacterium]|nr:hypothetical protein [Candidatus Binatia bacterium]
MPEAARPVRRRAPTTFRRRPDSSAGARELRAALLPWAPPALAAAGLLVLYFLGHLDVIDTPPALAIDAFLLLAIVLYFPMRYARRLDGAGAQLAAGAFAAAWLAIVYLPIYQRIYPSSRIASLDVTPEAVPVTLPTAGHGTLLDVVIDGHLERAEPGSAHVARYSFTIEPEGVPPRTIAGEFKESWLRQRQGRRDTVEVLNELRSRLVTIRNPANGDLRIESLSITGDAPPLLTISVYRHTLPPWWVGLIAAAALLAGAAVFDRATGAGETAASMAVATGTAVTGAFSFPAIGSPHPTFRELAGAAIVGGLVGGPIGGLVGWWFRRRVGAARRARARGR